VVGDHRQAIFGVRGADQRNILQFAEHYEGATVVDLDINYRSTPQIVSCFNAFFDDCQMTTPNNAGPRVRLALSGTEEREAQAVVSRILGRLDKGISPGEIAVLYRVHALSRAIEERLRDAGIRYQVVGGLTFYERAEVKDVIAYLRLICNPHSNVDLQRVINVPRRAISAKTVDKLRSMAHAKGSSLWDAIPSLLAREKLAPKTQQGLQRFMLAIKQARQDMTGKPVIDDRPLDLFNRQPVGDAPPPTKPELSLVSIAHRLLDSTGYREYWSQEVAKFERKRKAVEHERALQKQRNVEEVVAAVGAYQDRTEAPTLAGYIEEVALMADQDELKDGAVSLMTIHAAKGLEYDAVFVVGCEEGLLPFSKAIAEGSIDEETRLAFVACSRARKWLTLSMADFRFMYGERKQTAPSRFFRLFPHDAGDIHPKLEEWRDRRNNNHVHKEAAPGWRRDDE
ncbi:MAG: ATP-dependent helicase, partial [Alphaproteobacteria bacterium]